MGNIRRVVIAALLAAGLAAGVAAQAAVTAAPAVAMYHNDGAPNGAPQMYHND